MIFEQLLIESMENKSKWMKKYDAGICGIFYYFMNMIKSPVLNMIRVII